MFSSMTLFPLILIFLLAAAAVWLAGIKLSETTDIIDQRFGLGEALGGMIFLAIATNLPEIAIVVTASLTNNMSLAIGNILGGIAIQTVVLVILDGVGLRNKAALTHQAASMQLVLEGILVICVLVITIMGTLLPMSVVFARIAPGDLMIAASWILGLWLISKARFGLPWTMRDLPQEINQAERRRSRKEARSISTTQATWIFMMAAIVTLIAGAILEESSSAIAVHIGWSGVLFGSTFLALATSLPEISTGLAAIRVGEYTLAVSDIFGGNAFLPVLFLPATLLSGKPVLPHAANSDIYLASLGALLTGVYIYGLIFRYKRQYFYLGIDSIAVLVLYILGMIGLFAIT